MLPLRLVGGWLGAGKTRFINHLLRHAGGRRIAVLVNDFGELPIDAELLADAAAPEPGATVLALAGGCLCCSFGDDLVGSLAALARRQPAPDLALLELNGVALPANVARSARLAAGVQVDGCLVLADAGRIRALAADPYVGDTARAQLQAADWLMLTHTDTLPADAADEVERWAGAQCPTARVLRGPVDLWPPELLLDWPAAAVDDLNPRDWQPRAWAAASATGLAAASHGHALPQALDAAALQALGAWLADPAKRLLRAKALARDAGGQGWLLQVAGSRVSVQPQAFSGPPRLLLLAAPGDLSALSALPL